MAEENKTPAAAPAAAPTQAPPSQGSASSTVSTDGGASAKPPTSPVPKDEIVNVGQAANEARSGKPIQRSSTLISNPPPVVDPELEAARAAANPREKLPDSVPQSTIDEMAAGKKALERNRPVATALENARAAKEAGVSTSPETNPVDATHSLQQQGKV
jgi:hypothetical protein